MSDMSDRVEAVKDVPVDNKEKKGNKLTENIAETLDNDSLKEEFFKKFKEGNGAVFMIFRELSNKNLVDKDLIKSVINDTKAVDWFFDYLDRGSYLKYAEDIFSEAWSYYCNKERSYKMTKIMKECILLLYKDGKKHSVDDKIIGFSRLYADSCSKSNITKHDAITEDEDRLVDGASKREFAGGMYMMLNEIRIEEEFKHYEFPFECGQYLLREFNRANANDLGWTESCGADFVLNHPERFGCSSLLLLDSIKMSKFNTKDQLKYPEKILDKGFGRTLARSMINNFSQEVRLDVIEWLLKYGFGKDVITFINSYENVNRQKVVDMLYDYGYGKLVEEGDIMGAKKRNNK